MNFLERVASPTPPFFQKIRNIGIVLSAVCTALVSAPVALPAIVVKIAGYLIVAGTVMGAVSQATIPAEG